MKNNIVVENITEYRTETGPKRGHVLHIPFSIETKDGLTNSYSELDLTELGQFYDKVSPYLFDLLVFSGIIYSIDRSISRKRYSINGLCREISVSLPCSNQMTWGYLKEDLLELISFMTGDLWTFSFIPLPKLCPLANFDKVKYDNIKAVTLFSGGMDSLIGAIDLAESSEGNIFLSSHYDSTMGGPKRDQKEVYSALANHYHDKLLRFRKPVRIQPQKTKDSELSSRSRSLMFISIAAIVAAYAKTDIIIPENGSVSLNYPLSASRRSACSTRTTHPILLYKYNQILDKLGLSLKAINPYEFSTKGEMVNACKNIKLLERIVPLSNSCGKRSQHQYMYDNRHATHCGRCMPCMYRKASMVDIPYFIDMTTYGIKHTTLFTLKKGKLSNDFFAMLNFLKKDLTANDIKEELKIIGLGKLPHLDRYVDLVLRTRGELCKMLQLHSNYEIRKYLGWE